MKIKHYFFLLFLGIFSITNAQHIIKPNGDVAAKPDLKKISKLNPNVLVNARNLRISGKTSKEIAAILKQEKATATDVFTTLKPSTSDHENVSALCAVGFFVREIVDALKLDGKTALQTTELLKSSPGCSFERADILKNVYLVYQIPLEEMVPIIQAKFTTERTEIVGLLARIHDNASRVADVVERYGFATNRRELCELFWHHYPYFKSYSLTNKFGILNSTHFPVASVNYDFADAFLFLKSTAIGVDRINNLDILQVFKQMKYYTINLESATELGNIAKYLNVSREDFAQFLRRSPEYNASLILDALQATYGS